MTSDAPGGALILINGASSAGKSTLAHALRDALPVPFLHFSLDFFLFGPHVLPRTPDGRLREWDAIRPQVFGGFHRCLPALLAAGNNLVVDYIAETPQMWQEFRTLLAGFDVFLVSLHCPVEELERRERARGDRGVGDARRDALTVHTFTGYDLDLSCSDPLEANVQRVVHAWEHRGEGAARAFPDSPPAVAAR
ncbi:chloramphenicol 3-O phosphotransferase [Deinococcus metalli]|uniref:Chloramphenicol 3-O phosphotransferase n=1 Tax=Deinococcus metalli TaxID=1141878 RepID=A0A7W8NSF4_9DEIO|nr:AAA family ATPase [Deinococcus metalli]MBB5377092.1 chloramphenicol 3-O phosphotransferase [Deinococcus metalli]